MGTCLDEAVLTCTHNQCFEQKIQFIIFFYMEFFITLQLKKSLYTAWVTFRYDHWPRKPVLRDVHQDNMSMKSIPPCTPLLYSKIGVCRGIPNFLIFALKHRLWVLVSTASARRF